MLNPDYREILSIFSEERVQYLLVGAYAVAAHGRPGATDDIDLWINPSAENSARVHRALVRFGSPVTALDESEFTRPQTELQIGVAPQRIDILTGITGVDNFEEAYLERLEVEIEGVTLPVLSRRLLIENKRAAGRPQDLADLGFLERTA